MGKKVERQIKEIAKLKKEINRLNGELERVVRIAQYLEKRAWK